MYAKYLTITNYSHINVNSTQTAKCTWKPVIRKKMLRI